jgi:hypothetical protein
MKAFERVWSKNRAFNRAKIFGKYGFIGQF